MSKLWIVHPRSTVRAALARATGLPASGIAEGGPSLDDFEAAGRPDVVLLAFAGELEAELAFARAVRRRAPEARWLVVCPPEETGTVERLFDSVQPRVLTLPPDRARLRAELARALAHRSPAPESLAERERRARIAARFDAWLGPELPGLALALDPGLRPLPLLVRGEPGSGRSLLLHHAEQARGGSERRVRLDGRVAGGLDALVARLRGGAAGDAAGVVATVWIDEVDALPVADQRALADWIIHGLPPAPLPQDRLAPDLRWLATAGPAGLTDRLDEALARAFVPLTVSVPPLSRAPEALARIADCTAREWAEATATPRRRFADSALNALADSPLWGERAELEAVLRASLAASDDPVLEAERLCFPEDLATGGRFATPSPAGTTPTAESAAVAPVPPVAPAPPASGRPHGELEALPLDRDADPSAALLGLTGPWAEEEGETAGAALESRSEPAPTVETAAAPGEPAPMRSEASEAPWRRLARSLSHEIRNPLVSIRTFTELLPEHYADETFRARFQEFVGKDVGHIQDVVSRLAKATERDRFESVPVDVSALIDRVLAARREAIAQRRQVVLSELERDAPFALADRGALETALDGLVDRALASLPDRGDLFVTTRRIARASDGRPRLRILLRHHNPQASGLSGELDPVHQILEYVLAETIVGALGGRLTIDPTLGPETLIVIDLPTP